MTLNLSMPGYDELKPRITVFGVGGAGGNAVDNMIDKNLDGVDFVVGNTDAQALQQSKSETRIQLGVKVTEGLGAGARASVGAAAAEESIEQIVDHLAGAHMCFITAGMGGGTGTGAAPIIAQAARELGVLTVGVVTKPFQFEGAKRMRQAEAGVEALQKVVDTLIIIPNQNLFRLANEKTTFTEAFSLADDVLYQGVKGVTDLMVRPGLINLDFADVRSVMDEMGKAMMGTGEGEGENRALEAAEQAIANPLLDGVSMAGAKGVIISIIGGEDMRLLEVDEAANHIRELVDEDANIIWGSAFNPDLKGKIRVSVVATGIEQGALGAADRALPTSLGGARAPKRPVLELGDEAPETPGFAAAPLAGVGVAAPAAVPMDEDFLPEEIAEAEPFDLTGMQAVEGLGDDDYGDEYDDDVDGIVDPLAGLRGAEDVELGLTRTEPDPYGQAVADDDTLDLGEAYDDGYGSSPSGGPAAAFSPPVQDDFLADADRLASDDRPVEAQLGGGRRRGLIGGGGGGAAGAGSTLFERMANLSRSTTSSADDDEDDGDGDGGGGPALSIPRFLGRQNNQ